MSQAPPLTDLHCHFVPGVDDGAPTREDALRYLGEFVQTGIRTVCTTPHLPGLEVGGARQAAIEAVFADLADEARRSLPSLSLSLAFEVRLDDPEIDFTHPSLALGEGDRVLVEFPMLSLPAYPDHMLAVVTEQGRVPVLAHPERYYGVEKAYGWVERWREAGAILCVNAGSLWGEYGPEAERVARRMLALGHADLLASDHHGRPHRDFTLRRAYDLLADRGAENAADVLLAANPAAVLEGGELHPVPPVSLGEEGLFGRLRRAMRGGTG